MKYEDCKYLKITNYNPNYKECYLNVKFLDRYLPIISYSSKHNTKSFRNYLPYLRMYKQRIIDNVRQGNYDRAGKYVIDILDKTEKFNVEYKEAYLESKIRNS